MNVTIKLGLATVHINKEKGNLYVKNRQGESKPITFAAYIDENECLGIRDYMNLTGKTLVEAATELEELGVVLIGHKFDICFYDEETVEKFVSSVSV